MRTLAIIQAHMGSSRLPGKVLKDIEGESMLARVVRRTQRCRQLDDVVVATSTLPADNAIVQECRRLGVSVFRGSNDDVLARFFDAARFFGADVCVRITSDCPLIDPEVSEDILTRFFAAPTQPDYASNKIPQSFPRGLDTEVFTLNALKRAHMHARLPAERAHVTLHMYQHPEAYRLLSVLSDVDRADWRWTVDTEEDLRFVREVYSRLGAHGDFGWREVVGLLEQEPYLREINRCVAQKPVCAG